LPRSHRPPSRDGQGISTLGWRWCVQSSIEHLRALM
jgi:hypothetical protein